MLGTCSGPLYTYNLLLRSMEKKKDIGKSVNGCVEGFCVKWRGFLSDKFWMLFLTLGEIFLL